jgi:hypothetical protein
MKIGFSIAVYDKFEELEVCVDIIKNNFNKFNSVICVGTNNPDARMILENNSLIDFIVDGEDLKQKEHTSKKRFNVSVADSAVSVMRTASNTFASVNKLIETDVDYIVTLHSDSWILNQDKLLNLIELMKQKNRPFAFRDLNIHLSGIFSTSMSPYLIDFFMIMDRKFIEKNNIFNHDTYSLLPGFMNNVHTMFYYLIAIKIEWKNTLCYSTHKNFQFWDGEPVYYNKYLAPYCYDPFMDQVHINIGSFFDNLGQALQAQMLIKYKFKGNVINKFIDKYSMNDDELQKKLFDYDNKYSKKLKWLGMNFKLYGLSRSHSYIEKSLSLKQNILKLLIRMITVRIVHKKNEQCYIDYIKDRINQQDLLDNNHFLWHDEIFLSKQDQDYIESK